MTGSPAPHVVPPGADPGSYVHVAALAERNGWRAEVFGASVGGTPLVAWWPNGPAAPTRVVWAAMHGEEVVTGHLLHTLLRTNDAREGRAVVVPVLNPDGCLAGTRQNARGVDLNRNFPTADWSPAPSPTFWPTTMTRTTQFRTLMSSTGDVPGSEPEVQAIMALIERVQPSEVVDVHAPLECVLAMHPGSEALAAHLAEPAKLRVQTGLDSPTPGDGGSWCDERGIVAVTYEVEAGSMAPLWHRHAGALARAITSPPQP